MGYVFIALGVVLLWLDYLGAKNIEDAAVLAYNEVFTGNPPFWKWLGALIIIGAIGYVPELEPPATAMLALVLVAIVLKHDSDFTKLLGKV